jgi:hypothetical protein
MALRQQFHVSLVHPVQVLVHILHLVCERERTVIHTGFRGAASSVAKKLQWLVQLAAMKSKTGLKPMFAALKMVQNAFQIT